MDTVVNYCFCSVDAETIEGLPVNYIADITILQDGYEFVYRNSEDSLSVWGGKITCNLLVHELSSLKHRNILICSSSESVPYDGAAIMNVVSSNLVVVGVFYTLASVGVIFTIACLIFNIVLRNRK